MVAGKQRSDKLAKSEEGPFGGMNTSRKFKIIFYPLSRRKTPS